MCLPAHSLTAKNNFVPDSCPAGSRGGSLLSKHISGLLDNSNFFVFKLDFCQLFLWFGNDHRKSCRPCCYWSEIVSSWLIIYAFVCLMTMSALYLIELLTLQVYFPDESIHRGLSSRRFSFWPRWNEKVLSLRHFDQFQLLTSPKSNLSSCIHWYVTGPSWLSAWQVNVELPPMTAFKQSEGSSITCYTIWMRVKPNFYASNFRYLERSFHDCDFKAPAENAL